MKRIGYLFPQLCSFGHLLTAFQRARKGSGHSQEALRFGYELEPRLLALQASLQSGAYAPQAYRYFEIRDPKVRIISVAPFVDRVVHHAVVGLLEPLFDRSFLFDSYATRKGKGSHAAILRAQTFLRKHPWFFKADIHQYFASIQHDLLLRLIENKVKDQRFLQLTEQIIRNGGEAGKGLPIGNLTSQFFANVYLNPFDHWIKQALKANAYLRYMDDFVLFGTDKATVKAWRNHLRTYLEDHLQLELKPTASFLNHRRYGLSFLGARIFPNLVRIHPAHLRRSLGRLDRQSKAYLQGTLSEEAFVESLESHWAYVSWFDTQALRKQLVRDLPH